MNFAIKTPFIKTSLKRFYSSNYMLIKDQKKLESIIEAADNKVLYFTASWCPPCRAIGPIYEKASKQFPTVKFIKIDIDEMPEAAGAHAISSVPTFIFFNGSKIIHKVT